MALQDTHPVPRSSDATFKVHYNVADELYLQLYGCDNCYFNMEKQKSRLSDDHKHLYDDALDYTDGYVLEANIKYPLPVDVAGREA